ncbi:MAG: hypothetical protein ABI960_02190 [Candidatus Eisenbacteria bacterium]
MIDDRAFLRHTLATLAYRGGKATRGADTGFGPFLVSPSSRTPLHVLAHIGDLLDWGLRIAQGQPHWTEAVPGSWEGEVQRFHRGLQALDAYLASDAPLGASTEKIFQGPIADALTHVGQIAMLRRVAGDPIKGESYFRAEIESGRVGPEQVPPRTEFE